MGVRLARRAEADLEQIALSLAESGSRETAERAIAAITERFSLLADYPHVGRARDQDLGPGRRSFPVDSYVIVYRIIAGDVQILRVAHGRRDLRALMRR